MIAGFESVAFVLLVLIAPGLSFQRLLGLKDDPALVLPLGILLGSAAYLLAIASGWPWLFPIFVMILDVPLILIRGRGRAPGPSLRGAVPATAGLVLLLALTVYPLNRRGPHGGFILDHIESVDTAFHAGLAWELANGYPPEVPGLAGVRLSYHFGADLLPAAFVRFTHVSPYDCLSRIQVTLSALALLLVVRALAGGFGAATLLASFSLILTDFSFLTRLVDHEAHWWADLLTSNLLPSVVLANSTVPALALALGSLLALRRAEAGEGRGWLLVSALLGLGVPFFKVFMGAQFLGGLAVAILLSRNRSLIAAVFVPAALATLALASGAGSRSVLVKLDPFGLVQNTLDNLNLPPASRTSLVGWAILWIVAGLGLRILGLKDALKSLFSGRGHAIALATIALSGIPLGLLFRITLREQPGYDESAYFVEQGGVVLWIFASCGAARLLQGRSWAIPLFAALSLPSSVEFVAAKWQEATENIPTPVLRAMEALKAASQPGDVVLERPRLPFPPPPLVFAGRRVAYTTYIHYLPQFAPGAAIAGRHATLRRFFDTKDYREAQALAHSLNGRFLCLYPGDPISFDPASVFTLVFADGGTIVYRIPEFDPGASAR